MDVALVLQIAVACAVAAVTGVVGWLIRTVSANQRRTDTLESRADAIDMPAMDARIDSHGERLAALEARHDALPEISEEIGKVHQRVDELGVKFGELAGELRSVARFLETVIDRSIPQRQENPSQ